MKVLNERLSAHRTTTPKLPACVLIAPWALRGTHAEFVADTHNITPGPRYEI